MTNNTFEVNFHFAVTEDTDLEQTAQLLQEHLTHLEMVKEAEAVPEEPRLTGVEVVAAIGVTVLVLRGSTDVVKELRKLIQEIRGFYTDIKGLKSSFVEIKEKKVQITETQPTDEDLDQLIQ